MTIQTKLLDEIVWNDSTYADCAGGITMDWELAAGLGAQEQDSEAVDEIRSGESNTWRIHQHFTSRPTNEIPDACTYESQYLAKPFEFGVNLDFADSEYESDSSGYAPINDLYFRYPEPDDGDGASEDAGLEFALAVASGVSSSVYAGLAGVLVNYTIDGGANFSDSNNHAFNWEIPVSGNHEDLPRENGNQGETAEVRFNVDNETEPGGDHYVKFLPEYTFRYPSTDSWNCGCSSWFWDSFRSVSPYLGYVGFTSV